MRLVYLMRNRVLHGYGFIGLSRSGCVETTLDSVCFNNINLFSTLTIVQNRADKLDFIGSVLQDRVQCANVGLGALKGDVTLELIY